MNSDTSAQRESDKQTHYKSSTLDTLLLAKAIYNLSKPLIYSDNNHTCSAGLILLQDCLELVILALLREKGICNQENMKFDQLLGNLNKVDVEVPNSLDLKALNKQRVLIKHFGRLAESTSVRTYAEAVDLAIDKTLPQVIGKTLQDVLLTDCIPECEAKSYLEKAIKLKQEEEYFKALTEIRKAFFVEYEKEYDIHEWVEPSSLGLLGGLFRDGKKAPFHKRNKDWINKHVECPFDYIQIDYERMRYDALEWGIITSEIENLRRLTPKVIRLKRDGKWKVDYDVNFRTLAANEKNLNYCLDLAINIILKKRQFERSHKFPPQGNGLSLDSFRCN